ncbi:hypothetical protein [Peteryoungia ipomoeae]|uniref:Uncharacterized protein n=1 Tax=Peteryoungia ipomoeae TaxID=1210932 RepID=A0A4S8P103_9HYPH|nr:hypothetical protein [Peteryoungia ipomoeae]THV23660.1 hypothetical protein FAA97_06625 [Peteryoungia ipomoeae]
MHSLVLPFYKKEPHTMSQKERREAEERFYREHAHPRLAAFTAWMRRAGTRVEDAQHPASAEVLVATEDKMRRREDRCSGEAGAASRSCHAYATRLKAG